ncbi:MAG: apolipoprotein N-acyltransferase [Pseudomonadota bacterium]|nr:apolipoprotein N-acyltransferase [Pseudomonadota bacterium]MDE3036886.1 apolipoprotein N-acyltransferase [Pseudomonadota bacterium]
MIGKLSPSIANPTGWKRNAVAFLCGVMATLTLAPFFIFPLIIPAFAGLLWLMENAPTGRRAFWDGWWWGYGFYISGLYWFCIALMTDPEKFAWLIPFALFGLTAVIAVYCGVACWLTILLIPPVHGENKKVRIFIFSVVWTCVEYARGHLFGGFPWNLAGYSFGFSDVSVQMASLVGVYGLTFFAVLLGSSFAVIFPSPFVGEGQGVSLKNEPLSLASSHRERGDKKSAVLFLIAIWILFAAGMGWGGWRLHEAGRIPASARNVSGVRLRLVQGNVPQSDKWDPKLQMQGVETYLRLTQLPGLDKATHVIWPETAVPFPVRAHTPLARALGNGVPPGVVLITGALRAEGINPAKREAANFRIWNSLVAINHHGDIVGTYDKARLVPFGEFLPFRKWLPEFLTTPAGDIDFSRGPGRETLEWPGLPPIFPMICYEAIFPGRLPPERPGLLLNVTNDAWFGDSIGPRQHFEMARMRAVEQGVPLVRVANTGITAIVDSFGRVISSLTLGVQGVMDTGLPVAQPEPTVFGRNGNLLLLILILAVIFLTIKQRRTT